MAVGRTVPILQIVGYQNSGKTTLVEKLIQTFSEQGLKVATIKHHGHGGSPTVPQKDSERHRKAGAIVSAVEGDGLLLLTALRNQWSLQDIIRLYTYFEADLIVIEGYKTESYPKVVLLRTNEDVKLLDQVENVLAVITWNEVTQKLQETYTTFPITEEAAYMEWLLQSVRDIQ